MKSVTLENLAQKVQENRLRNLARNIIQYQHFKTNVILKKIDNAGYSQSTLRFYIDKGIGYIKTGKKIRQLGSLCEYLDECMNKHIQPLTPKNEEKRIEFNRTYRNNDVLPVQRVLQKITQNTIIDTNKNIYAVKMGKNIRLQESIEEAKGFLDGLSFIGNTNASIIQLTYKEV